MQSGLTQLPLSLLSLLSTEMHSLCFAAQGTGHALLSGLFTFSLLSSATPEQTVQV